MTLVEMLVSLALTLFLLTIFTTLVVTATGGISTMRGITAIDHKVRNAVTTIRADLDSIYVANGGSRLKVSELFTDATQIPDRGYFSIEENSRSVRQGMDAWNQPVELDTDDVISFIVERSGTSSDQIFHGRVTHSDATLGNALVLNPTTGSFEINDIGEYLDSVHGTPLTRFDSANNFLYTSRFAEVIYYLRPADNQYRVGELRSDPQNPTAVPTLPALYNLYRRQLLVVEDASELNRGSPMTPNGILMPTQFYDRYDISASREFEALPAGTNWAFNGQARIHFNTLQDVSRREFRYGMQIAQFDNVARPGIAPAGPPYVDPNGNDLDPSGKNPNASRFVLRGVGMSHQDFPGNPPFVHDYDRIDANGRFEPWFGRPTQRETGHPNYPFWNAPFMAPQYGPASAQGNYQLADAFDRSNQPIPDGLLDAYDDLAGQRSGEDILLTNVVSWDVKVLEDIPSMSASVNSLNDFDFTGAPYNAPGTVPMLPRFRRPEFIDLGQYADSSSPSNAAAGADTNVNVVLLPLRDNMYHYVMHPQYAPFGVLVQPFEPRDGMGNPTPALINFGYGPDGAPGIRGFDDDADMSIDEADEYDPVTPVGDDYREANIEALINRLKGPDGAWGIAGFDDDGNGTTDDVSEYLAARSDDLNPYVHPLAGANGRWGGAGNDDNAPPNVDNPADDILEYLWAGSDDVPFNTTNPNTPTGVLFGRSGQVGETGNSPLNLGDSNPRNTYDSWSQSYNLRAVLDRNSEDGFRPVPYPRPLKAIQIRFRVLEPKTGIVREVTIVHRFK